MFARSANAIPPLDSSRPVESVKLPPIAWTIPEPPSLVALPPTPIMNSVKPASRASTISCPTPNVEARRTSRSSGVNRASPTAFATSMTAVVPSPSAPHSASIWRPIASSTFAVRTSPPEASTSACSVPSPPSATGTMTVSASGHTRFTPADIASAISMPVRLSLNPCGASTTFFMIAQYR